MRTLQKRQLKELFLYSAAHRPLEVAGAVLKGQRRDGRDRPNIKAGPACPLPGRRQRTYAARFSCNLGSGANKLWEKSTWGKG